MDIYNLLTIMKENYLVEKLSSQTQSRNNKFLLIFMVPAGGLELPT